LTTTARTAPMMTKSFPENIIVWVDEGEEGWKA
jgi:hypothetical protein